MKAGLARWAGVAKYGAVKTAFFRRLIFATVLSVAAWGALPGMARGEALDPLISNKTIWDVPHDGFVKANKGLGFRWLSDAKDQAETQSHAVTLFSGPVYQVDVGFKDAKVSGVTVSIYNRGDAGDLTNSQWVTILKRTVDGLTAMTGVQPVVQGREAGDAVNANAVVWQTPETKYLLEYSFTREIKSRDIPFRAQFIRLQVVPPEKPKSFMEAALAATSPAQGHFEGLAHVKKDTNGDVRLETVPMVDQGAKGYCVVASAERVLRYYGVQTDENELAELANASASRGTSEAAMFDSLKKLSQRLRVRIRTLRDMDARQLVTLVTEYNRVARRSHAQQLPDLSMITSWEQVYGAMQPALLKEARTHSRAEVTRFQQDVTDSIDQGIPLLWSVMLGVMPETKAPKGIGGHMRLIIGYNAQTSEILYTDSWGPGHELKRMPLDNAWTMTMGLDSIEPL